MQGNEPSLHVVAAPGERRERIVEALRGAGVTAHDSLEGFRREVGEERCRLVVDVESPEGYASLLELCGQVAEERREWIVLLPVEGDGGEGLRLRPISAGFAVDASAIADAGDGESEEPVLFDLHDVLRFVARIRHDLNNPLTAGMAETQLLLMDVEEDSELGESLTTIHRQLERIQGLVEDLTRVRRPPRES